ncbi:unnamed protein product [Pieris macdunnoughi]|uniref:Uncharacterized protein n=1 Tax=Pieris macdunnoughi TaxID=345717 RepID=A0A821WNC5_9NEOP|nr:unnamed protein product [Pieris macdunnoughi]
MLRENDCYFGDSTRQCLRRIAWPLHHLLQTTILETIVWFGDGGAQSVGLASRRRDESNPASGAAAGAGEAICRNFGVCLKVRRA